MADTDEKTNKPTYAANHWGPMAPDPWAALVPVTPALRQAVKRAWLRDGGSEEDFVILFKHDGDTDHSDLPTLGRIHA